MIYSSSPVESCLLHIIQVKQFKWNTLLLALLTRSLGEIPWEQPAHLVPKRLAETEKEKIAHRYHFLTTQSAGQLQKKNTQYKQHNQTKLESLERFLHFHDVGEPMGTSNHHTHLQLALGKYI